MGAAWGVDSNDLRVERSTLDLPNWDADGFKVALLADLHCNNKEAADRAIRAVQMAKDEKPDCLVLPGDFVNYSRDESIHSLKSVLRAIEETGIPSFCTMGNHDYWVDHPQKVLRTLGKSKVKLLRNEAVEFSGVTIFGIDDGILRKCDHSKLPSKHSRSTLALFHEPDMVDDVDPRISLMVAGHSHGGEICLPFQIPIYAPKYGRKYIKGFYPKAKVPLYVTRGIGISGRVRLFCPPEVSILTLKGA